MRSLPWTLFALLIGAACGNAPPIGLEPRGDAGQTSADAGQTSADAGQATPDAGTTPISGQRLKARFVQSEDGRVRRLLGLFDSVPGQSCWLTRFAGVDDRVFCYPRASGTLVSLDAACTQLAVETSYGDHSWVLAQGPVRLGRRITPAPAQRYYYVGGGRCSPTPEPVAAPLYEVAEQLSSEALAGGTVVRGVSDDRLGVLQFIGDDGSSVPYRLSDTVAQVDCTPGETEVGPRCRPETGTLHDEGRLDERCDRLAILDYSATPVAVVPERGGAIYRFDLPQRTSTQLQLGRVGPGGMCMLEETNLGRYTLHLGTPYPPRDWAPIALDVAESGALRAVVGRLPSGAPAEIEPALDPGTFFELDGQPCGPVWTSPTDLRCLPTPSEAVMGWVTAFADARCTERVLAMREGSAPPAEVLLVGAYGAENLPVGDVRAVGEALDIGRIYVDSNGTCTRTTQVASYFRLRAQIDPSRFPALRLVTEEP